MIRVLIVDDEALAREEMTRLVRSQNGFEWIGEAANGKECLQKLKKEKADVVFLDVDMPGMNGLEVASRLASWDDPPLVVFATAYDKYAVEAFRANAIDYVLKPCDPARLRKTFERIKDFLARKGSSREKLASLENTLIQKGLLKRLVGHPRNLKDRVVIDPAEVLYFYSENTEVLACLGSRELIVNSTLKELVSNLDPAQFAQTHKAYLVNLHKIEKLSPMFSGNYEILLKGMKTTVPLSRRYARPLKNRLGSW